MKKVRRVLLDADGVIIDFVGGVLKAVENLTDGKTKLTPEQFPEWDIFAKIKELAPDLSMKALYNVIKSPHFCEALDPYPEAEDALAKLIKLDEAGKIELHIVTSPWDSATWMYERTQWFKARGLPGRRIHHAHEKHIYRGDLFVDDKPENVRAWEKENEGAAFLWNTPHNQPKTGLRRLYGWGEFFDILSAKVK